MKVKGLRWWIIGLIALATIINYIDRSAMPEPSDKNPLLEISFAIPFDRIKPEHVEPAAKVLLDELVRASLRAAEAAGAERLKDEGLDALKKKLGGR